MTLSPKSSQQVNSAASNSTSLVSSSITVAQNDIIVVKFANENAAQTLSAVTNTGTAGAQTWTPQANTGASGSQGRVGIVTAVASAAGTVTITVPVAASDWHSATFNVWDGTQVALPASPLRLAKDGTVPSVAVGSGGIGTGAPLGTTTSCAAGSVLDWVNSDFAAVSPASRAYRSSAFDQGVHDKSTSFYVAYYAYQQVGSTGTQTVGLTLPTGQTWNIAAIELTAAAPVAARVPLRGGNRAAILRASTY